MQTYSLEKLDFFLCVRRNSKKFCHHACSTPKKCNFFDRGAVYRHGRLAEKTFYGVMIWIKTGFFFCYHQRDSSEVTKRIILRWLHSESKKNSITADWIGSKGGGGMLFAAARWLEDRSRAWQWGHGPTKIGNHWSRHPGLGRNCTHDCSGSWEGSIPYRNRS